MALCNNGAQINTITPNFGESHSLEVGSLSGLVGRWVTCVDLGNVLTWPVGFVVIWIKVDGVQGYDEDHIALVILDLSNFAARVPIILGTPTISCIMNVIKEKEIDALGRPWVSTQVAYLLAVWWAMATVEDSKDVAGESNCREHNEIVITKETETIDAFLSHVIHARQGLLTLERGSMWWLRLYAWKMDLYPRVWWYRTLIQSCTVAVRMLLWLWEIVQCTPDSEEEDPIGEGSCHHMGTRDPWADQFDRGIRRGPQPSDTQANYEAKAREVVWGVRSEWIGILATWAGSFCPVSLGWIPWHLFIGAQWTWLYPFNQTCDYNYQWYSVQRMI